MKSFIVSLVIFMSGISAFAKGRSYAEFSVDWTPGSLSQQTPMICDDNNYTGIRIVVLGQYHHDFEIEMHAPLEWKMTKISPTTLNGQPATEILINADSNNGEIIIHQIIEPGRKAGADARIDISDAC